MSNTRLGWIRAASGSVTVTVVFLGIVVAGSLLYHHSGRIITSGDIFPKSEIADVQGNNIAWPAQHYFVVYTKHDSEMGMQVEKFVHLQQQKHREMPPVITIVHGNDGEIREFSRQTGVRSAIVRDRGVWRRRLGLRDSAFRLFLVDEKSRVAFATDYAEPDDVRQLAEKSLKGQVIYRSIDPSQALRVGDRFTGFSIVDMRTDEETAFASSSNSSVICFTSHCPSCDLEAEIARYAAHEIQVAAQPQPPTTLLFSSRFSRADLRKTVLRYGIKANLIQATENIPGLEDALSLETFSPSEIVRVDLAAGGIVRRIVPWSQGASKQTGTL